MKFRNTLKPLLPHKSNSSSSFWFSVPSILRSNRLRREPRQLDEEEEMWFNEEDDFDDGEAVVPAATSNIINKKLNHEIESIGIYLRIVYYY